MLPPILQFPGLFRRIGQPTSSEGAQSHEAPVSHISSRKQRWRRLVSGVLMLVGINVALEVMAISSGALQHASDASARLGLARCRDIPCFRGLIPGQSPWSDALNAVFVESYRQTSDTLLVASSSDSVVFIRQASHSATVGQIMITIDSETGPSLGDIIHLYGSPCAVSFNASVSHSAPSLLFLYYPRLLITTKTATNSIAMAALIQSILFINPADPDGTCRRSCVAKDPYLLQRGDIYRPWFGFSSIGHYQSAGNNMPPC